MLGYFANIDPPVDYYPFNVLNVNDPIPNDNYRDYLLPYSNNTAQTGYCIIDPEMTWHTDAFRNYVRANAPLNPNNVGRKRPIDFPSSIPLVPINLPGTYSSKVQVVFGSCYKYLPN